MYFVLAVFAGIVIGSFINICIYRLPLEIPLFDRKLQVEGRDGLSIFKGIPALGLDYMGETLKHIGLARFLLTDAVTALLYVLLLHRYGLTAEFLFFAFLFSALIIVLFVDIDNRIIPDKLVIATAIGGCLALIYNIFKPLSIYGDRNWWNPLLGVLPGSGFLLLVAILGILIYKSDDAMGMGDVKIFAPIGLFLGWRMCIAALVISVFLGGLTGAALMISGVKKRRDSLPFGPFIAIGTIIAVLWGNQII